MSTPPLAIRVAAEIRAEMGRQRLSGRQVAARVGKPSATVSRWVRGKTPVGLDEIEMFADVLGVTTVDLISRAYDRYDGRPTFGDAGQSSVVGERGNVRNGPDDETPTLTSISHILTGIHGSGPDGSPRSRALRSVAA